MTDTKFDDNYERKRRNIMNEVRKELEQYFLPQNMRLDPYLQQNMTKDGYVDIKLLTRIKLIENLIINDEQLLIEAIRDSRVLTMNSQETMVKYVPLIERKISIIRDLPNNVPKKEIYKMFDNEFCAKPVEMKSDIADHWFIKFKSEDDCTRTTKWLQKNGVFRNKKVNIRVKTVTSNTTKNEALYTPERHLPPSSLGKGNINLTPNQLQALNQLNSMNLNSLNPMLKFSNILPAPSIPSTNIMNNLQQQRQQQSPRNVKSNNNINNNNNNNNNNNSNNNSKTNGKSIIQNNNQNIVSSPKNHQQQQQQPQTVSQSQSQSQVPVEAISSPKQRSPKHQDNDVPVHVPNQVNNDVDAPTPVAIDADINDDDSTIENESDYPGKYINYNRQIFLEIYRAMLTKNDLKIPDTMRGRDSRVVSEKILTPVSMLKKTDKLMSDDVDINNNGNTYNDNDYNDDIDNEMDMDNPDNINNINDDNININKKRKRKRNNKSAKSGQYMYYTYDIATRNYYPKRNNNRKNNNNYSNTYYDDNNDTTYYFNSTKKNNGSVYRSKKSTTYYKPKTKTNKTTTNETTTTTTANQNNNQPDVIYQPTGKRNYWKGWKQKKPN